MPATKDQIAETFRRHVERYGYGKASVEDVSAELGISKRTVYQHFGSKREIYEYVLDDIAAEIQRDIDGALARLRSPRAKMERFLGMVVSGMRQHIQATEKADWMQEFEVAYDAMAAAYGSIGTRLVAEGLENGDFSFGDPWLANELVGAIVTHYGVLVRDDAQLDRDDEIIEAIMRMLGACEGGIAVPRKTKR